MSPKLPPIDGPRASNGRMPLLREGGAERPESAAGPKRAWSQREPLIAAWDNAGPRCVIEHFVVPQSELNRHRDEREGGRTACRPLSVGAGQARPNAAPPTLAQVASPALLTDAADGIDQALVGLRGSNHLSNLSTNAEYQAVRYNLDALVTAVNRFVALAPDQLQATEALRVNARSMGELLTLAASNLGNSPNAMALRDELDMKFKGLIEQSTTLESQLFKALDHKMVPA